MKDDEALGPVGEPFDRFGGRGMAELELLDEALIEIGEEDEAAIAEGSTMLRIGSRLFEGLPDA